VVAVSNKAATPVRTIEDLAEKGVRLVMAGKQVPIAVYTAAFLQKAEASRQYGKDFGTRVRANAVSEEPDVRMIVTKVALGEGDAGIVYVTDLTADVSPSITALSIPDGLNVTTKYGIGLVASAADQSSGRAFYDFVLSPAAQPLLLKYGFLSP
jgi:molybdate transport system substrate-binding protein